MILLDTCAVIWIVNRDSIVPEAARAIRRASAEGSLFVSPVSAWEIGMLTRRGRLTLSVPPEIYVAHIFAHPGVRIADLTPEIAVGASYLPGRFHEDPADRLLVSTALSAGLRILTRDRRILDYAAAGHVPVIRC